MRKIVLFLGILVLIASCKKNVHTETVQSAKDKSLAQMHFIDVIKTTLELVPLYAIGSSSIDTNIAIKSTSSLLTGTFPNTVTIDYGTTAWAGSDGKLRSGKIIITLSGSDLLKDPFDITFEDFYLENSLLLGTINVTYSNSGADKYDLVLNSDVKVVNGSGTMAWNGSASMVRSSGTTTLSVLDDVYTFSESTQGQDFKGEAFTSESTENFTVDFSCRYLVTAGKAKLTPLDEDALQVNYGAGSCDGTAEVLPTGEENAFYFTLP